MSTRKNREDRVDVAAFATGASPSSALRGSANQSAGPERFASGTPCEPQPVGMVRAGDVIDPDEEADTLVFARCTSEELDGDAGTLDHQIDVPRLSRPVLDLTEDTPEPAAGAATRGIGAGIIERDRIHRRNVMVLLVLCVLIGLAVALLPRAERKVPARPDRGGMFGAPEPAKGDADPGAQRPR